MVWPASANSGAADLTEITAPILSPPALTGDTPVMTVIESTLLGSIYDNGEFM